MKNNPHLISVILPTYNEAENIIELIEQIDIQVSRDKEVIVVDDNSPDGTSKIVKDFIRKSRKKSVRLETRFKNPGLTNSLQKGIGLARGDIVVWLDCDFSMPPSLISKLLERLDNGYDIAAGSRFVKGGGFKVDNSPERKDSPVAIILSRLMNLFIRVMLGSSFKDYTSGFIAIKKSILKKIRLRGDYGEYFIDLIYKARAHKYRIVEVGYICLPRKRGKSKTGSNLWQYFRRGRKYIMLTLRLLIEKHILRQIP